MVRVLLIKKNIALLIMCSVILLSSGLMGPKFFWNISAVADASENKQVTIEFNAPMSFVDFKGIVKQYGIDPLEMNYEQCGIRGGYTVTRGDSIEDSMLKFGSEHVKFLDTARVETEKAMVSATDEATQSRLKALAQELQNARIMNDKDGLKINSFIAPDSEAIVRMRQSGVVKTVIPTQRMIYKLGESILSGAKTLGSSFVNVAQASGSHESWAPYGGRSDVYRSYTYQLFYFNNVGAFGSTGTYEHETQVYDKNFADYNGYWSSNMPSAYYDTPFGDTIDNFTIGTYRASTLATYRQYFTYMSLRAGSASWATVRIKGQRGHRYPSWCYSTWCVYADATTQSMATMSAPTSVSWQY